jgi:hypothetical protein
MNQYSIINDFYEKNMSKFILVSLIGELEFPNRKHILLTLKIKGCQPVLVEFF